MVFRSVGCTVKRGRDKSAQTAAGTMAAWEDDKGLRFVTPLELGEIPDFTDGRAVDPRVLRRRLEGRGGRLPASVLSILHSVAFTETVSASEPANREFEFCAPTAGDQMCTPLCENPLNLDHMLS